MPKSPSSSAQAAREAVAVRLRELMLEAGLTGTELAVRCRWSSAKSSRIINAKTQPSDSDIRTWCSACCADDQAGDLIAASRAVESMYLEWRRLHRNGMRKVQQDFYTLHERTSLCRSYASNAVPGFLQTPAYATALMAGITDFQGTPDDIAEAVVARVSRSRFLYKGNHRFVVILEEWVLRSQIADRDTMACQLRHLLRTMPLPSLSLGVIPFTTRRSIWPLEAFFLYDDQRALVETLTAEINVTQPREVTDYRKAFAGLMETAVHGDKARALINHAIDALG
ncbi:MULTISPECIES: helix-turn-helix transcriptional regulator [unclassified Streptomyces]|uniref:helix-turn-helix domain-containing protein n=1 Tax=unclassified Streptomyces TaxID=2593676 RepID=UPI000B864E34|nr:MULTISPECIES: helix-turn-helix transcriptional regulator [unclassified Streptomyces]MYR74415.1 helix-turn-helix domain-containing protein [Streptomyces sp. SID4925]